MYTSPAIGGTAPLFSSLGKIAANLRDSGRLLRTEGDRFLFPLRPRLREDLRKADQLAPQ